MPFHFIVQIELLANIDVLLLHHVNVTVFLFFLRHRLFFEKLLMIRLVHGLLVVVRECKGNDRRIVSAVRSNDESIRMFIRVNDKIRFDIILVWLQVHMMDAIDICLIDHPARRIACPDIGRGLPVFQLDIR